MLADAAASAGAEPASVGGEPIVDIDSGLFKYVLLKAEASDGSVVTLVRGYNGCEYHADVLERSEPRLSAAGLSEVDCVGGGRIKRDEKSVFVYGYSQAFGRANHAQTAELVKARFPQLEVSWSNEGY